MLTDEQRAAGWIEHDGGPCPVPPDSEPGVIFADGEIVDSGGMPARYWMKRFWEHNCNPHNRIIAYRLENPND